MPLYDLTLRDFVKYTSMQENFLLVDRIDLTIRICDGLIHLNETSKAHRDVKLRKFSKTIFLEPSLWQNIVKIDYSNILINVRNDDVRGLIWDQNSDKNLAITDYQIFEQRNIIGTPGWGSPEQLLNQSLKRFLKHLKSGKLIFPNSGFAMTTN